MNTQQKNRFVREVEAVAQDNPCVDMDLIKEWQKMAKMLDKLPPPPEPEPAHPPRLQPIPLKLFNRF